MAKKKGTYADAFNEAWQKFFEQTRSNAEMDAKGYVMISAALAYIADELADLKAILSQKGVK